MKMYLLMVWKGQGFALGRVWMWPLKGLENKGLR